MTPDKKVTIRFTDRDDGPYQPSLCKDSKATNRLSTLWDTTETTQHEISSVCFSTDSCVPSLKSATLSRKCQLMGQCGGTKVKREGKLPIIDEVRPRKEPTAKDWRRSPKCPLPIVYPLKKAVTTIQTNSSRNSLKAQKKTQALAKTRMQDCFGKSLRPSLLNAAAKSDILGKDRKKRLISNESLFDVDDGSEASTCGSNLSVSSKQNLLLKSVIESCHSVPNPFSSNGNPVDAATLDEREPQSTKERYFCTVPEVKAISSQKEMLAQSVNSLRKADSIQFVCSGDLLQSFFDGKPIEQREPQSTNERYFCTASEEREL